MIDRRGERTDSAGPCAHKDADGFAVYAPARFDEVVAAENLPSSPNSVEGVALAGAASWWAFRSANFDDMFAVFKQEHGESGAVGAGSFHGPAPVIGKMFAREVQQL